MSGDATEPDALLRSDAIESRLPVGIWSVVARSTLPDAFPTWASFWDTSGAR